MLNKMKLGGGGGGCAVQGVEKKKNLFFLTDSQKITIDWEQDENKLLPYLLTLFHKTRTIEQINVDRLKS